MQLVLSLVSELLKACERVCQATGMEREEEVVEEEKEEEGCSVSVVTDSKSVDPTERLSSTRVSSPPSSPFLPSALGLLASLLPAARVWFDWLMLRVDFWVPFLGGLKANLL